MSEQRFKQILPIGPNLYHVISEPGDCTRYDYFVYQEGYDKFNFMPRKSTFRFPQSLYLSEVEGLDETKIPDIKPEYYSCNAYTLLECIRTMKKLKDS